MAISLLSPGRLFSAPSAEALLADYSRSGNSKYLTQLITACGDDLYYFLLKQSDAKTAEDVSQQSWLKVIEKHRSFQGSSSFKTWLFSIGRHCLIDELRQSQRWQNSELDDNLLSSVAEPWQTLAAQQQQLAFEQQLALLPFVQREALILQLEGFSLTEIAVITGEGVETIKSRLRYARQHLQQTGGVQRD